MLAWASKRFQLRSSLTADPVGHGLANRTKSILLSVRSSQKVENLRIELPTLSISMFLPRNVFKISQDVFSGCNPLEKSPKHLPNISQHLFFFNNKLGDDIIPRRIIITVITHLVITKALPQRAVAEDGIQGWDQGAWADRAWQGARTPGTTRHWAIYIYKEREREIKYYY